MPAMPHSRLEEFKRFVRYAYFLRFSLMLWLFPLFLSGLNFFASASLSSGILTPEFRAQYICVGFFLVSAGFVALISTRVVLINGTLRWDVCYEPEAEGDEKNDGRPYLLKNLLANDLGEREWAALRLSQAPNLLVFGYLIYNSVQSDVSGWTTFEGLMLGAAIAVAVWIVANAWYYLNYEPFAPCDSQANDTVAFGQNAARTLLFPRSTFLLEKIGGKCGERITLENASTWLNRSHADRLLKWVAHFVTTPGYTYPSRNGVRKFYEGHTFSILSVLVFLGIYLLIWPLSAPIHTPVGTPAALILLGIFCLFLISVFVLKPPAGMSGVGLWWKVLLSAGVVSFYAAVLSLHHWSAPERFPTLALILILVIWLSWMLGGLAFFLDRYRVPVLTFFLLALIVPRILHGDLGREEHYFSATSLQPENALAKREVPTPAGILDNILKTQTPDADGNDPPLIIVTSTGGGLHASAWTTAVLAQLEKLFKEKDANDSFHRHLLLASTVSGGSVGLYSYLEEINGPSPDFTRMQVAAQCSSLEAVAWGLAYYDMPKALLPLLPILIPPSDGIDDLVASPSAGTDTAGAWAAKIKLSPIWKDRTWALRRGFLRNSSSRYCYETWKNDHPDSEKDKDRTVSAPYTNEVAASLSLRSLIPSDRQQFAFAMNTTADETGGRFLLANYKLLEDQVDAEPNYRAKSFLESFKTASPHDSKSDVSDLPLATAAQLSATFPYVSSAARVPRHFDEADNSVHFVDGGYYDNDGTASAVEFLRYALAEPSVATPPGDQAADPSSVQLGQPNPFDAERKYLEDIHTRLLGHPLRIVLLEIRNSPEEKLDKRGTGPEGNGYRGDAGKHPANLLTQLGAPIAGFWQAGHISITGRNRVLLAQLEHAMAGKLQIHRVVIADNHALETTVKTDPLSWSLTPAQRREVQASAVRCDLDPEYKDILDWFHDPAKWQSPKGDWHGDSGKPE